MGLPSRCLAMNVYSDFTIQAFESHNNNNNNNNNKNNECIYFALFFSLHLKPSVVATPNQSVLNDPNGS
jgi:hypothetical protein